MTVTGRVPASTGKYDDNGKLVAAPPPAAALDVFAPSRPSAPAAEPEAELSLPAPGARIGQYELIRELGRGGMGAVYAARDTKLGRKVAIKFLEKTDHPELTARFLIEAKATARCSHENIVVIHEVGEHDGNPFMVLEYLQGAPLSRLLKDGKQLPPAQAIELMVPVVRALTVAHAHDIVHRDLKPDNIFVTDSGTIKVLDFGIAKLLHGDDEDGAARVRSAAAKASDPGAGSARPLTVRGTLVGTLPYMSPEQWGGGGAVDHQTDLWAAGIILFEMVAGHHPLAPLRGWDLMVTGVVREPMPGVRTACPSLPDELAGVIDRCLQKPEDQRIASARELLDALEPLLPGRYVRRLRSDESPYPGLKSFQESDAHRFFGRTHEVAAAVARLRDAPLLGIVGPSGVGKSSFVRAGIVPALKASGEPWSTLVVRPGRSPMATPTHNKPGDQRMSGMQAWIMLLIMIIAGCEYPPLPCGASGRRCTAGQTCAAAQDVCVDVGGCGDGIINREDEEICDDGNIIDGDGCSADCKSDETCGNTIIDPANGEECDTGITDTPACNGMYHCTIPKCGDGYANMAFIPSMAIAPEQCDVIDPITNDSLDTSECNGNNNGSDGPGSCRFPTCGDGYVNLHFTPPGATSPESCDSGRDTQVCNGNNNGANGPGSCQIPSCGDGYRNPFFTPAGSSRPEECEAGIPCGTGKTCSNCNCV